VPALPIWLRLRMPAAAYHAYCCDQWLALTRLGPDLQQRRNNLLGIGKFGFWLLDDSVIIATDGLGVRTPVSTFHPVEAGNDNRHAYGLV